MNLLLNLHISCFWRIIFSWWRRSAMKVLMSNYSFGAECNRWGRRACWAPLMAGGLNYQRKPWRGRSAGGEGKGRAAVTTAHATAWLIPVIVDTVSRAGQWSLAVASVLERCPPGLDWPLPWTIARGSLIYTRQVVIHGTASQTPNRCHLSISPYYTGCTI